jgi:hypothetical protein
VELDPGAAHQTTPNNTKKEDNGTIQNNSSSQNSDLCKKQCAEHA